MADPQAAVPIISINILVSAFLGFLSALAVQWLVRKIDQRHEQKELWEKIEEEIRTVLRSMESVHQDSTIEYLVPYETPVWDGSFSSGAVSAIRNDKPFLDVSRIYWKIHASNSWEKLKTEVHFSAGSESPKYQTLVQQLSEQRGRLLAELKKVIEELHGWRNG